MSKENRYQELLKSLEGLFDKELTIAVNQLNVLSVLKEKLGLFWVGLYLTKPDKLVLGPYAGTLPCTKIEYGSGLCGLTASKGEIHRVNDVSQLDNYIACHPETQSEIVIPGFRGDQVVFVLDIDSTKKDAFDSEDEAYLKQVAEWLVSMEGQQ
jgi:L-methionine (R)-S-oxide reductase